VISDLQIPFEHEKALSFCTYLKRHYKIADDHVLNVGDELDCYHGGRWPKDPDGKFSATGELAISKEKLKAWYNVFPQMKLAISNHGLRWVRKASAAEIPTEMMRSYREIIDAPEGWKWAQKWVFDQIKHPFLMIHGMGYGGVNAHRTAALDSGMSLVHGHLHSHAGISYIKTENQKLWGFNTGCLIDFESYAFSYGKESRFKPCLGAGLIFNGGSVPMWMPLE
jgi:UDP-2,3-diacylglucosamine pyrophosphatase LpxH